MPPATRSAEREEERRLNTRTLTIASVASASAAAVTSQLWIAGTWVAAALTPVLVTLLSEALHRPTERIARAWTSDRPAPGKRTPRPRAAVAPPHGDPLQPLDAGSASGDGRPCARVPPARGDRAPAAARPARGGRDRGARLRNRCGRGHRCRSPVRGFDRQGRLSHDAARRSGKGAAAGAGAGQDAAPTQTAPDETGTTTDEPPTTDTAPEPAPQSDTAPVTPPSDPTQTAPLPEAVP